MEVSGQIHAPTVPTKQKQNLRYSQEDEWASEPVQTIWRRYKSLVIITLIIIIIIIIIIIQACCFMGTF
jgi:glycerol-3-phosphate dehydrogenase